MNELELPLDDSHKYSIEWKEHETKEHVQYDVTHLYSKIGKIKEYILELYT